MFGKIIGHVAAHAVPYAVGAIGATTTTVATVLWRKAANLAADLAGTVEALDQEIARLSVATAQEVAAAQKKAEEVASDNELLRADAKAAKFTAEVAENQVRILQRQLEEAEAEKAKVAAEEKAKAEAPPVPSKNRAAPVRRVARRVSGN